ncbi:MAG: HrpE/YscL family type III secretion apparatus protein [Chlamydiales bacterium]|nr:HrpE/YscL family type III secretion apparatus protein [Chlamydiales bacterium]NCF70130.1 HrpE/YscL family type III secretion apparatus protein [Chlamydiales bacterium]
MKLFQLLPLEEQELLANLDKKVIPSEDFSKIIEAQELIEHIKESTKNYKEQVATECERIKEKAQEEGFAEGLSKWNEQLALLEQETETVKNEMQKIIVDLAMKAAKKIVGQEIEQNPNAIVGIVSNTLKPVSQHQKITVYVHPSSVQALEKHKPQLLQIVEHAKSFSIEEKDDIKLGGCVIETEAGIINAELDLQWQALETAFQTLIKKRES